MMVKGLNIQIGFRIRVNIQSSFSTDTAEVATIVTIRIRVRTSFPVLKCKVKPIESFRWHHSLWLVRHQLNVHSIVRRQLAALNINRGKAWSKLMP